MNAQTDVATTSPRRRDWFRGRRGWLIGGAVVVALGLWLGWEWLAAVGALPLILTVLPCAAMCVLGLCMKGSGTDSCHQPHGTDRAPKEAP
jgi:hypothetical protein